MAKGISTQAHGKETVLLHTQIGALQEIKASFFRHLVRRLLNNCSLPFKKLFEYATRGSHNNLSWGRPKIANPNILLTTTNEAGQVMLIDAFQLTQSKRIHHDSFFPFFIDHLQCKMLLDFKQKYQHFPFRISHYDIKPNEWLFILTIRGVRQVAISALLPTIQWSSV